MIFYLTKQVVCGKDCFAIRQKDENIDILVATFKLNETALAMKTLVELVDKNKENK